MALSITALTNNPENLQLALKKLPVAVSLLLVIACAYTLSHITWRFFTDSEEIVPATVTTPDVTTSTSDPQAFRTLTAANLFGEIKRSETARPTKVPETRLNLVLKGVLAADPMTSASAIIARSKGSKEEIYGIGDKLPGGVTIKEIHPEHVILERKGQLETLRMPKDSGADAVQLSSAAGRFNDVTPAPQAGELSDIRRNIIKNPTSFSDYALPIVVRENGKQIGYRLQPQKKGELLAELGLEPSDVITSVNGIRLDDPKNGIGALRKLSTASQVTITVKRNGAEVPLNIQLQ